MFDISSLNPLWIQIPLLLILLFGLISGIKDGVVKKIVDLVFFVILVVAMVFFVPPLAKQIENTGFIQSFIDQHVTGDMATLISGLLTGPIYVIITSAGVLLAYFVIKFFVNFILTRVFKKNAVVRILGGVWQIAFNLVFCGFLMVVIASPTLFKGGHELLSSTQGVKQVYSGVTKVQEVLKEKNLPYNLESGFGKVLAGKDATSEDIARYTSTLERVPSIIQSVNDGTIVSQVVDSEGNINQEKANELLGDLIVFSDLVNKLPESQQEAVAAPLKETIVEGAKSLDGQEGTIEVNQEQKDSFIDALGENGLNLDKDTIAIFESHITVKE